MSQSLSATQAARRLGVKLQTLYAYVSRGMLLTTRAPDGKRSMFDAHEVEQLAAKGRRSRRAGEVDVVLETATTDLGEGTLRYRGHLVSDLAQRETFETVAELLWNATPDADAWRLSPKAQALVTRVLRGLPNSASVFDRAQVIVAALAARDPMRHDRRKDAYVRAARELLSALAFGVPPGTRAAGFAHRSIAPTVAEGFGLQSKACNAFVQRALILLADHELAASTFAARIAASTRADVYGVVAAGLGALSGPLHGRASTRVTRLLIEAERRKAPALVLGEELGERGQLPGFGHKVYVAQDPRGALLLESLRTLPVRRAKLSLIEAMVVAAKQRAGVAPNVDFGLAAFAFAHDLPDITGEVLFVVARVAGWVAHALEEYEAPPLRFRARAHYVGR